MALLFTVLLGLSAGVLGYFSYYFNRNHYISSASALIDTDLAYLTEAKKHEGFQAILAVPSARPGHVYLLEDEAGRVVAGNLGTAPRHATVLTEGVIVFTQNARIYAAKVRQFADGGMLLSGIDITAAARSYRIMQWLSLLSILLMAVVVGVSFLISTFVVSRTNRIAATARAIMATGDLSRRIAIDARWDDLSNTASVLNALLDRVEALMLGIRRVSENVAHDLRTPLTRLLNGLETLRAMNAGAAVQAQCDVLVAETGRLFDTFNALLRITHIETVRQKQNFAPVDLREIAADVVELYEPLAEDKGISIRMLPGLESAPLTGDRDLLFQAVANLLDNAVKFTPDGGSIALSLRMDDGIRLTISDTGPGVPPDERDRIFERFHRGDASRGTAGNGLGLALVAAVVRLHDGTIALADAGPGLVVEIRLDRDAD